MLRRTFERLIAIGRLTVITAGGRTFSVGTPPSDAPDLDIVIRLKRRSTAFKLALNPTLHFGEAYMDGDLVFERGDLRTLFELYGRNCQQTGYRRRNAAIRAWRRAVRLIQQRNQRRASRRNVAHHYDLSNALYRQFLDEDMQYSCAYFREPGATLEQAQEDKKRHIAAKLKLAPGQRVLDIGSGWGGLALSLARWAGVRVTGVTLSEQQIALARRRAIDSGLDDRVQFDLRDYRDVEGPFDRIVSVGMFEHVGVPNFDAFFGKLRSLLTDDGVALIHSIGRMEPPGVTNGWIRKYIFPGGYVPALSETLAAVERAGLYVTDIEILRLHYAETCRHWLERFHRNAALVRQIHDDRFFRMWDFYLAVSEMGFRYDGLMVFQLQLSKRVDTLPITRDYMRRGERALEPPIPFKRPEIVRRSAGA